MTWNWKEQRKQKTLFRSYYCVSCHQVKPCQLLTGWSSKWQSYCCQCYFQSEQKQAQEYSDYQQVYQAEVKTQQDHFQQLELLRNYSGCSQCGSLEVNAYDLYENSRLVCQPCLMNKEGQSSSPVSFSEQSKWYRKRWRIDLAEWLTNYQHLPVNADCAKKWLADNRHLKVCNCLELEAKRLVDLFAGSSKDYQKKLKNCSCKMSEKFRVDSDYSASCEKCESVISVASKKRVIKNRNDPRFWGLSISEKVLCGDCLENLKTSMPSLRKAEFNRYRKVKRI
ncbi:MAG: hypothetical protein I3273_01515 [Candidatus Moeniiplasma glomeromycotorum]|nr:hypothetical protein [Candidatus Moeniiplasma glomeromycotorum]MCE8167200.1 hypothetical protein [Candidatus Moeniiplasma glomeromycotorum]MCE8168788.1 hypothetical protein [Candidatus Moeniiplasma glomeromycotorum]